MLFPGEQEWLSLHPIQNKKDEREKAAFKLRHKLGCLNCLCGHGGTVIARHLLGVLKCIGSLLGLNDNRNHPNLEGNYLSGDLLQSGECFFRIFFFFTVTDLLLSPPLINCCYLNVMKLKTEIKPVVQAMTLGQPTGDCGSLLCNISTPLRCALRETVWDRRAKGPPRG